MDSVDEPAWSEIALDASKVFTPTSPIDEKDLFAGRDEQVRAIIDVVNQRGQHGLLYGERGVGKTSLANILSALLTGRGGNVLAPRVNCASTDDFSTVWRKVFEEIELKRTAQAIGFNTAPVPKAFSASELLGEPGTVIDPDRVRRALVILSSLALPILIIDEFDRLAQDTRRAFADTIKTLSDHAVPATVILVGVADSVDQLIQEHQSVERALVQIPMPRMSASEIAQILTTGVSRLGMEIDQPALARISTLAQGFPHYAHLLGLASVRAALDKKSLRVTTPFVDQAVDKAIANVQQSIKVDYDAAIRSPRKDNLFSDVLLACALAKTNDMGLFAALDVREPFRRITGKNYDIPSFAQHLNEFCEAKRGPVLKKSGTRRLFRYQFVNPLLQPFVIMNGMKSGRIPSDMFGSSQVV
jgi:Cdc6-like AAA superfamily ATPase